MRWLTTSIVVLVILILMGVANVKKPGNDWEPRWFTNHSRGGLLLATTLPFTDGICWPTEFVDAFGNVIQAKQCILPGGRQIRFLGFGVTLTDGDAFAIADCDVMLTFNSSAQSWSQIELGDGRTPGNCITAPPGDDLDAVGEFCWIKNPDPVALTEDGSTFWLLAAGDGDATCADTAVLESVQMIVFYEERDV